MKAMIRVNSLSLTGSGNKTLSAMERHGKRLDASAQKRRVRDVEPLVYGSLDLTEAYAAHVGDARMNAGLKRPAMHAIIKFPDEITITDKSEQKMLDLAVDFINRTHGGDAVFAARLDRDEAGQHVVDVFYAPKYEKATKDRKGNEVLQTWVSTSRHGKALCEKHRAEIMRRNDKKKFSTTPRSVGIALQAELHEYLTSRDFKLVPRQPKNSPLPDRLETEAYKAKRDLEDARAEIDRLRQENRSLKSQLADLVLRVGAYVRHRLGLGSTTGKERFLLNEAKIALQPHQVEGLPAPEQTSEDAESTPTTGAEHGETVNV